MQRVIMAVVYAVEVQPGEAADVQMKTFERFTKSLPDIPGVQILFGSPVLAPRRDSDIDDPDFDVEVYAHGRYLHPIPQRGF